MSSRATVIAFVRLGRPLFLVGGFVMYALGAAIAEVVGYGLDPARYALGQAAVTAFQLMTHYANEYYDYDADTANPTPTAWSGGSRVLADGVLPRDVALYAALALAGIGVAVTFAIAVVVDTELARVACPLLTVVFVLAWGYSAPPLRLCARGAGELVTAVVVAVLVPALGFAMQARPDGEDIRLLAIATFPLACLQAAMLLAIELPDAAGDAAADKRTLVVRLGARTATWLQLGLIAGACIVIACMRPLGLSARAAVPPALTIPFAVWQIVRVHRGHARPDAWERIGLWAVVLVVGTGIAEVVGFLYARLA